MNIQVNKKASRDPKSMRAALRTAIDESKTKEGFDFGAVAPVVESLLATGDIEENPGIYGGVVWRLMQAGKAELAYDVAVRLYCVTGKPAHLERVAQCFALLHGERLAVADGIPEVEGLRDLGGVNLARALDKAGPSAAKDVFRVAVVRAVEAHRRRLAPSIATLSSSSRPEPALTSTTGASPQRPVGHSHGPATGDDAIHLFDATIRFFLGRGQVDDLQAFFDFVTKNATDTQRATYISRMQEFAPQHRKLVELDTFTKLNGWVSSNEDIRNTQVILYADIDSNIIDGSSVWLSSMASVLCSAGTCILVAKRTITRDVVISNIQHIENLIVLDPSIVSDSKYIFSVDEAIQTIRLLDSILPKLRLLVVRGLAAATCLFETRQFYDRSAIYVTDFVITQAPRAVQRSLQSAV